MHKHIRIHRQKTTHRNIASIRRVPYTIAAHRNKLNWNTLFLLLLSCHDIVLWFCIFPYFCWLFFFWFYLLSYKILFVDFYSLLDAFYTCFLCFCRFFTLHWCQKNRKLVPLFATYFSNKNRDLAAYKKNGQYSWEKTTTKFKDKNRWCNT